MKAFLSGTALAAAVLFAPHLGRAQTAPAPQAGALGQLAPVPQEAVQRMQQAEATLRQAAQAYGTSQEPPQTQAVRQALGGLQQAMGQMPDVHRAAPGHRALEREVAEAQQVFQAERVDPAHARAELDQVLAAMQPALAEMGATGAAVPEGGARAAAVVVRESAPTVQVQQAAPVVTVQQPEPVVTVVVPQPEIIVRQPPPQVTVYIPPPRALVQQVQPEVRVIEAQPQIQITPAQAQVQVQVQQAQPRVQVQQAPGQPTVRYEQQGEAQVRMDQQGQQMAAAGATAGAAVGAATGSGSGAQPAAAGVPLQRVTNLVGTNLVGAQGRDAGEVENLLLDQAGNVRGAVVQWGGFFGIGARRAVVPIERIQFGESNERARLTMTREQLEQLDAFERDNLTQYGTRYGWGEGLRLYR